jgi:hypothetical protein
VILLEVLWTTAHVRLADVPGDGNCGIRSILSILGEEGNCKLKVCHMRDELSMYLSTYASSEPDLLLAFFVLEGCDVVLDSDDDDDVVFVV